MKLSKVIRLFDIFALYFVPSHKGDRYHRTVIGGIFSVVMVLALGALFTASFYETISKPQVTSSHFDLYDSKYLVKGFNLSTNEQTVAGRMLSTNASVTAAEISAFFRI